MSPFSHENTKLKELREIPPDEDPIPREPHVSPLWLPSLVHLFI